MHDISSKLTGDSDQDVKYLMSIGKQYKDHRYSKEILRAIGRMLYDVMPENKKEELGKGYNASSAHLDKDDEEWSPVIFTRMFENAKLLYSSKDKLSSKDEIAKFYDTQAHYFIRWMKYLILLIMMM